VLTHKAWLLSVLTLLVKEWDDSNGRVVGYYH
jgi:hypothetical protein